jgi:hypothetical protein
MNQWSGQNLFEEVTMRLLSGPKSGRRRGLGRDFEGRPGAGSGSAKTPPKVQSSRDVILRTDRWPQASELYQSVLGFKVASESETLVGLETGAFRLYVEKGEPHGPVFDFLAPDVQAAKARLPAAGCTLQEENPSVPRCYIRDPYGLVFNLGQSPGT